MSKNQLFSVRFCSGLLTLLLLAACVAPVAQAPAATAETAADAAAPADLPVVGLMKLVSHPALDAEQQGVKDALTAAGFVDGETVILQEANAEGDIPTLTTIAQKFVDDGVDLIVTTSTPALQAAFNATKAVDQITPYNGHTEHTTGDNHIRLGARKGLLVSVIVQQGVLAQHRAVGCQHTPAIGILLWCVIGGGDCHRDVEGAVGVARQLRGEDIWESFYICRSDRADGGCRRADAAAHCDQQNQ